MRAKGSGIPKKLKSEPKSREKIVPLGFPISSRTLGFVKLVARPRESIVAVKGGIRGTPFSKLSTGFHNTVQNSKIFQRNNNGIVKNRMVRTNFAIPPFMSPAKKLERPNGAKRVMKYAIKKAIDIKLSPWGKSSLDGINRFVTRLKN